MNGTIYRIENSLGEGAYRGRPWVSIEDYIYTDTNSHPNPNNDSGLKMNAPHLYNDGYFEASEFFFGFSSISQLKAWFYNDKLLETFDRSGYFLVELEGEVYHGNAQSVINKSTSILKNRTSLLDICS